jgi:uncharacterized protein (TIGR00304 family)
MFITGLNPFEFEENFALADLGVFYAVGFALVIAGVALIVAAIIRASTRQHSEQGVEKGEDEGESHVRGAGVIMIGPIPIIFGTDKKSVKTVLALTLGLSIVFLLILIICYGLLG